MYVGEYTIHGIYIDTFLGGGTSKNPTSTVHSEKKIQQKHIKAEDLPEGKLMTANLHGWRV